MQPQAIYTPALIMKDGDGCSGFTSELPQKIVIDSLYKQSGMIPFISAIPHWCSCFYIKALQQKELQQNLIYSAGLWNRKCRRHLQR